MSSRNLTRRIAASVAALAIAVTTFIGVGTPSAAAAVPDPYAVTCESGESRFVCDAHMYSASYYWEVLPVSGQINGYITSGQYTQTIWGNCTGRKYVRVGLWLSSGEYYEEKFYCNPGLWP